MSLEETPGLFILICPLAVAGCLVTGQNETGRVPTQSNLQLHVSDFSSFWPYLCSISQSQSSVLQLIGVQTELWLAWLSLPRKALAKQKQLVAEGKGEHALSIHILIQKGCSYNQNRGKGTGQTDSRLRWPRSACHTACWERPLCLPALCLSVLTEMQNKCKKPTYMALMIFFCFLALLCCAQKGLECVGPLCISQPQPSRDICAADFAVPFSLTCRLEDREGV